MKRYIVYVLLIIMPVTVFAQKVYKWSDKHGKTHYGDKPGPASQNKKVIIKATSKPTPKLTTSEAEISSKGEALPGEGIADNAATDAATEPNLPQCISLAKQQAKERDHMSPQSQSRHKEMSLLCPNTSFTCINYRITPSKDSCTAKASDGNGTKFTVRNKARWSPSVSRY